MLPKKNSVLALPTRIICISFLLVIAVGAVLLWLPVSSRSGEFTPFLDSLFTATSATCVTGLVVYDTWSHWNAFGQVVILCLIQIGGLGLVTLTTFFNVIIGRKLGLRSMQLAQESTSSTSLSDISQLIRLVVRISLTIETIGALLLLPVFLPEYGLGSLWISVFLSISAYCNAGFDLFGRPEAPFVSLVGYADNYWVLFVVASLIVLGGLGFIVWRDLFEYHKTRRLSLHSRIMLLGTGGLIVTGTLFFLLLEWNNPDTMAGMGFFQKIANAAFQSVSCRTAGFNTIDLAKMHSITKGLASILMFIGAGSGSTGGGIKVTTFMVIVMTVVSVIQGREDATIFNRRITKSTVYKSLAILTLGLGGVCLGAVLITFSMHVIGIDAFFEATSAFATVGLSVGISSVANTASHLYLILLMFMGRVGPVSFALSLAMRAGNRKEILPDGKIIVG